MVSTGPLAPVPVLTPQIFVGTLNVSQESSRQGRGENSPRDPRSNHWILYIYNVPLVNSIYQAHLFSRKSDNALGGEQSFFKTFAIVHRVIECSEMD